MLNTSLSANESYIWTTANSTNVTDDPLTQITGPHWSFVPTYYIVVASASFLTNGSVMLAFFFKPSLRTPFNIYLMNLVTANFVYACIESPPDIINNLYSGWWLGSGYCSVYQYGTYVLEAGIRICHTLISINRIWAILWPHSYRLHHHCWTACLICLGGWAYIHANILPGFILDILYYRLPMVVNTCYLNTDAQWQWLLAIEVTVYGMAWVVMIVSYPLIWYTRLKRRKTVRPYQSGLLGTDTSVTRDQVITLHTMVSGNRMNYTPRGPPVTFDQRVAVVGHASYMVADEQWNASAQTEKAHLPMKKAENSSQAFVILTVLTVGIIISWTPILLYYTITIWIEIENPLFLQIAIVLFAMQSVVDPVLFVCVLPDLRRTFGVILCRRHYFTGIDC